MGDVEEFELISGRFYGIFQALADVFLVSSDYGDTDDIEDILLESVRIVEDRLPKISSGRKTRVRTHRLGEPDPDLSDYENAERLKVHSIALSRRRKKAGLSYGTKRNAKYEEVLRERRKAKKLKKRAEAVKQQRSEFDAKHERLKKWNRAVRSQPGYVDQFDDRDVDLYILSYGSLNRDVLNERRKREWELFMERQRRKYTWVRPGYQV
jgi:hypothetical protein